PSAREAVVPRRGGAFFLLLPAQSRAIQAQPASWIGSAHFLNNGATGMSWRSLAKWLSLGWAGRKYRLNRKRAGLLRRQTRPQWRRAFLEPLEDRSLLAATIIVNSTFDNDVRDNVLTLREAIEVNNRTLSPASLTGFEQQFVIGTPTSADTDTIVFNIPGSGVQTINLLAALPTITDPVIIDGYMQ